MKVRLSGQGDAPLTGTGPSGDLYVSISVAPHPTFKRDGADIWVDAPVPLTTAVLGGTARVPTIDGDVELKIPPGVQPEEKKVLRRRGVQEVGKPDGERGDQWVVLKVQIPKSVSERGKELLEEFAKVEEGKGASGDGGKKKSASASASASAASPGDGKRPFTTKTDAAAGKAEAKESKAEDKEDKGFLRSAFESLKRNLSHEEGKDGKDGKDDKDGDKKTGKVEA
jgi:molecular chaperone DnaJ